MFKNIYTTRMSDNRRVLGRRFDRINAKPIRFKKLLTVLCTMLLVVAFTLSTLVMAQFDKGESYTLDITNNGEVIKLENKPFIEDGVVYVPLRELFTKLGLMEDEIAKMEWDNGVVLISLSQKNLNEGVVAEYTSYLYKIEIGKSELVVNPEVLMVKNTPDEITSVVEPMDNAPILKKNITYIPFSYAERMAERADLGYLSPPDLYKLEVVYSGETLSIVCPLNTYCEITGKFGKRVHPITNEEIFHTGIDFDAPSGTGVYAGINGIVSEKDFDSEKGNYVTISNKTGVEVTYNHLSAFGDIYPGKEVESLSLIGYSGNTGKSTGAHLHMEVKINGEYVDPELYLIKNEYWKFVSEIKSEMPHILERCGYPDANYMIIDIDYGENLSFVKLKISKYKDRDVYDDETVIVICNYLEPHGWTGTVASEEYNNIDYDLLKIINN